MEIIKEKFNNNNLFDRLEYTNHLWKLIEQYPNANFIYTKRNHTDRYKSEKLPWSEEHWIEWEIHKEEFIDYILKQNKHLKVLHFNVCDNNDGWKELCGFLNKKIPNIDFPHANKRR